MGRRVIITGASSGIGEALAYHAASLGFDLCLAARNTAALDVVMTNCLKYPVRVITVTADVSSEADCKKIIDKTVEAFGGVDILINNAGISMRALFHDCHTDVLRKVMDVNFWGTVLCTKYAMPYLLTSRGSVVGISSIAGLRGLPGRTGYSASKFAVQGFLESLRTENLRNGLHVLIACPGYTSSNIRNTALNASGKSQAESPLDESGLMSPELVAKKVFQALAKKKNSLVLSFEGKAVYLLSRLFPAWLDKMIYRKVAAEKDSPFR